MAKESVTVTRKIETHKVNGLKEALTIEVYDEPGQGNACHEYGIVGPRNESETTFPFCGIRFQNGPIQEVGVNGISNEALLAVVRDRLEGFQSGPYACWTNEQALKHVVSAMESLHLRTRERVSRGVEGTHKV